MRIEINLASQPYEDVRRFFLSWGPAAALVVVFSLVLAGYAVRNWNASGPARQKVVEEQQAVARLDQEKMREVAVLLRSEHRELRLKSAFVNGLIARKTFSWTQVFTALEKIMPARVHVVSIEPVETKERQLEIQLRVAGDSREQALELVRRMEQSERFRRPQLRSETSPADAPEKVQFEIVALYLPVPAAGVTR